MLQVSYVARKHVLHIPYIRMCVRTYVCMYVCILQYVSPCPLQLSLEAVNARLVEKTRELNVVEIEIERLKVRAYIGLEHTYVCVCSSVCVASVYIRTLSVGSVR